MGFFNLLTWWVYDISLGWKVDQSTMIFPYKLNRRFDSASNKRNMSRLAYSFRFPEHFTKASVLNVPIQAWKNATLYRWISLGYVFSQENDVYICHFVVSQDDDGYICLLLWNQKTQESTFAVYNATWFCLKKHGLDIAGSPFRSVGNPSKCVP